MKLIAVLALAAVAFAEPEADPKADPWLTYGYGAYPYSYGYAGYRGYNGYPYAYYGKRSAEAEPEAEAEADPWYTYGYGHPYAYGYRTYGAYPYAYGYYGKRSAEAEPEAEADPALLYGAYGYPYAGVYGGYRTYGAYPYAYGSRFVYGKRSTEADPALLYSSSVAGGLVSPVVSSLYTHPVASVAAPLTTYTHAVAAPVVKSVVAAPAVAKTVVSSPVTYTVPHVAYPGVIYGKRSAEAEADPALVYSGVAHPLTYTHHVATPAVAAYTVPVTTVHKAPAHGVAATYAGLVHSSHVGVCLNNVGVQVPC